MVRPRRSRSNAPPQRKLASSSWRRNRSVVELTIEVLALQSSACKLMSDRLVAIGEKLETVRGLLAHGEWIDWLDVAVPFDTDSAKRYMRLAEFAREDPSEYRRLRHLGPGKLYYIMVLPPERRRRLPLGRRLPLPGGGRKTLEIMTAPELGGFLRDLALPPSEADDVDELVQDYRFRVGALEAVTIELAKHKGEIAVAVARELHGRIVRAAAALAKAFDL